MNNQQVAPEFSQDRQLQRFQESQVECTVITVNGIHIKGTVQSFDKYVVLIHTLSGKQSMIYKHAISTVK
ncbi:host factor-I protein [Kroppenstedtia sanguinis]|uniref:RNA chaperone Hfq n=1 Tax=Kroppenstedtia sanguinis TaxID=1380684 RepID=A0ABW4C4C9_9BACL